MVKRDTDAVVIVTCSHFNFLCLRDLLQSSFYYITKEQTNVLLLTLGLTEQNTQ